MKTMTKKVFGISDGYNGMEAGDIFTVSAFKDSAKDACLMGKSLAGDWCSVAGFFFIDDSGEPSQNGWDKFIPEEQEHSHRSAGTLHPN